MKYVFFLIALLLPRVVFGAETVWTMTDYVPADDPLISDDNTWSVTAYGVQTSGNGGNSGLCIEFDDPQPATTTCRYWSEERPTLEDFVGTFTVQALCNDEDGVKFFYETNNDTWHEETVTCMTEDTLYNPCDPDPLCGWTTAGRFRHNHFVINDVMTDFYFQAAQGGFYLDDISYDDVPVEESTSSTSSTASTTTVTVDTGNIQIALGVLVFLFSLFVFYFILS